MLLHFYRGRIYRIIFLLFAVSTSYVSATFQELCMWYLSHLTLGVTAHFTHSFIKDSTGSQGVNGLLTAKQLARSQARLLLKNHLTPKCMLFPPSFRLHRTKT